MPQALEVELILGKKQTANKIYYLAKWKNQPISEASWFEATWARHILHQGDKIYKEKISTLTQDLYSIQSAFVAIQHYEREITKTKLSSSSKNVIEIDTCINKRDNFIEISESNRQSEGFQQRGVRIIELNGEIEYFETEVEQQIIAFEIKMMGLVQEHVRTYLDSLQLSNKDITIKDKSHPDKVDKPPKKKPPSDQVIIDLVDSNIQSNC